MHDILRGGAGPLSCGWGWALWAAGSLKSLSKAISGARGGEGLVAYGKPLARTFLQLKIDKSSVRGLVAELQAETLKKMFYQQDWAVRVVGDGVED
jgi:hypothetical protein